MKGLSTEIESALKIIIDGLNYDFFSSTDTGESIEDVGEYIQLLEPDKMKRTMESKVSSFNSAKKILDKWMNSPNAPHINTVRKYVNQLTDAGENALSVLRKALAADIDFSKLEPHKHNLAIKSKPIILESIFDLDNSINDLKSKVDDDDLSLSEKEFQLGYPERFGKGEFFTKEDYYKDWYDEKNDAVRICPFSTSGEMITLDDFKIVLPEIPKDKSKILFSDLPKKEQYWRRQKLPKGLSPDNKDMYDEYIKEEFRRRREGIWFMNNGEPVYLTGNHYFALQWVKMLDSGGYMDFRYAQLKMFYHLEGVIIDDRTVGQLFVKSRRTGFTYIILSIFLNHITGSRNNNFGMTSKSDTDAQKAFLKFRYMLLNLPFFFIPLIKGKLDSPKQFDFGTPLLNTRETKKNKRFNKDDSLNNHIDYEPTKDDSYDGQALYMYLGDECYAPETKILTENFEFKPIKDLMVGDKVINGNGNILEIAEKHYGKTDMYEIIEPYGKNYKVNKNHRLIFEYGKSLKTNKTVKITPEKYINDKNKRLYRRKMFSGHNLDNFKSEIDPYILGVWLGDGYTGKSQFVLNQNKDLEIVNYMFEYFKHIGLEISILEVSDNYTKYYIKDNESVGSNQYSGSNHKFVKMLKSLNIYTNKRIPHSYFISNFDTRLKLLAGIIDTDGYKYGNNSFQISMSRLELIEDIRMLAGSLGLDVSKVFHKKSNYNTNVYSVNITDYNAIIPVKVERKKPIKTKKINRRGKIENIKYLGVDEYVGITLKTEDDNERSLVLESFSISGNSGKWKKPMDYIKHIGQITPTMLEGGRVVGKAFIGSTVGAMEKGGKQFKQLYDNSDITQRDEVTGMTKTGLYRYFLPAHENMTAFTDKYGVCYTTRPKNKTYSVNGKLVKFGSIEYLMSQEESKRKMSDNALNEQYRAYPRTINHAFRDEATESVYNLTKLYEQIESNEQIPEEHRYTIGNFDWKDGIKDADVVFNPNPKGRFKVAWLPSVIDGTEALANRVLNRNGKFFPMNKECVRIGVDPFSLKSTHGEGSKGAAHGKTIFFPEGGAPSNVFVFEYIARPSDETIFFEDMIKVMRYYGAPALVESNRIDLLRHMRNRGYRGFAMNRLDRPVHKLNPNEKEYGGQVMSGADILDSHMNSIGLWIERYVGKYTNEIEKLRPINEMGNMPFNETLNDWLHFNPEKRTKYDATISSGLAIMACQPEKYKGKIKKKNKEKNILPLLKRYNNKGDISTRIS